MIVVKYRDVENNQAKIPCIDSLNIHIRPKVFCLYHCKLLPYWFHQSKLANGQ